MLYRYQNAPGFSCARIKGKIEKLRLPEDVNETKKYACKTSAQKDTTVARNHKKQCTISVEWYW